MRGTTRRAAVAAIAAAAAIVATALGSCSSMPQAMLPPHADHHVAARFVVPANGRLALPASSAAVVVHELALEPAPRGEHFRDHLRWFDYAPGTTVEVRTRFRTWSVGGRPAAAAADVLAGAAGITLLAP